jgi:hypothetical protein
MVDIPRAIGIGVAAFVATLVINAVAGRAIGVDLAKAQPADLPASMWLVGIGSCVILSPVAAWWYFLPRAPSPSAANGMILGLIAVATGFVLDCVAIIPRAGGMRIMIGYLKSAPYWAALGVVFLGCTLVGAWGAR